MALRCPCDAPRRRTQRPESWRRKRRPGAQRGARAAGPPPKLPRSFSQKALGLAQSLTSKVAKVVPATSPPKLPKALRGRADSAALTRKRAAAAASAQIASIALEVESSFGTILSPVKGAHAHRAIELFTDLDALEDNDAVAVAKKQEATSKFAEMKVRLVASAKQQMKLGAREMRRSMMS